MKTDAECPWCREPFHGPDRKKNRDEHIVENECGLVPRQDREMAEKVKNGDSNT